MAEMAREPSHLPLQPVPVLQRLIDRFRRSVLDCSGWCGDRLDVQREMTALYSKAQ